MIRLIRKQRLDRVYRSAFECSKVLGCTCLLGILKHRKYTAYAINPCIHAGFTHSRLIESLPLRQQHSPQGLPVSLQLAFTICETLLGAQYCCRGETNWRI